MTGAVGFENHHRINGAHGNEEMAPRITFLDSVSLRPYAEMERRFDFYFLLYRKRRAGAFCPKGISRFTKAFLLDWDWESILWIGTA